MSFFLEVLFILVQTCSNMCPFYLLTSSHVNQKSQLSRDHMESWVRSDFFWMGLILWDGEKMKKTWSDRWKRVAGMIVIDLIDGDSASWEYSRMRLRCWLLHFCLNLLELLGIRRNRSNYINATALNASGTGRWFGCAMSAILVVKDSQRPP